MQLHDLWAHMRAQWQHMPRPAARPPTPINGAPDDYTFFDHVLFEHAADGILILDAGGRHLAANPHYCTLLGRTHVEVAGLLFDDLARTPSGAPAFAHLQAAHGAPCELLLAHQDGAWHPVEMTLAPLAPDRSVLVVRDLTARKQAEREQAFLSAIVVSSPDAIAGRDLDGRILSWNAGAENIFGYTAAEAIGQPAAMIVPPDHRDEVAQEADKVAQLPALQVIETQRIAKDGSLIDVSLSVFQVRDKGGTLIGVGVIMQDIRERKQAEAALRKSQEKLQSLFDVLPVGVSIVDAADRVHDTNPVLAQILHLTETGLLHGTYANRRYFRADSTPMLPDEFPSQRAIREQRTIRDVEIGVEIEDGTLIWTSVSSTPLSPSGLSATVTVDITERKQAEDALRLSEARLKAIIENTASRIWSVDHDYRLVVANAAFGQATAAYLGRPLLLGELTLHPAYPPAVNAFWQAQYDRALRGESFVVELDAQTIRGGTLECHMNPIRSLDGTVIGAAGITIDITKQKQAQQLLQDTNAELERRVAARTVELQETIAELHRANAGKDAFLATVSHELRTPLTGILALSEVLHAQGRDPLTPRQAQQVAMIHVSGQRLLDTVNGVLLYTSLAGGKYPLQYGNCSLADTCAEIALALRDKAVAKGQAIDVDVTPPDLAISSDQSAIAKLLHILLENAVKFTPQGGTVGITVGVEPQHDGETKTVALTVWDTGIGISLGQQAHLFDPFTQVDQTLARPFEGVGIGLASAHQLVTLLGGHIAVQSEPGCGARFTVTLPATPPSPTPAPHAV